MDFTPFLPNLSSVKDIATIAGPLTSAIVSTWVTPKLSEIKEGKKEVDEEKVTTLFVNYLNMAYAKNYFINTLAFPNTKIPLSKLYVPLSIKSKSLSGPTVVKLRHFPRSLLRNHKKILIKDVAGMGKSTILKFLFLKCIENNYGIPIFIQLRHLRTNADVVDVICEEMQRIGDKVDRELIEKLISQGNFIFFLDGYDEIPLASKAGVTASLQSFIDKAGDNTFILSSRNDSHLMSFTAFQLFTIVPLENKEAFELIRKYDRYIQSQHEKIGEILIAKITEGTISNIQEFLDNPLLVSLLLKSFAFKPVIPIKLESFYRQVYDALFADHDLTKPGTLTRDKYSKLDSDNFHRCLRTLAFVTIRSGKIEYGETEILGHIEDMREKQIKMSFSAQDFLHDLHATVPLFIKEGEIYRWSHKSIQEYFFAEFICRDTKGKQDEILKNISSSKNLPRYLNVLKLCKSIDEKNFRDTLLKDLLEEFFKNLENQAENSRHSPDNFQTPVSIVFPFIIGIGPKISPSNNQRQSTLSFRSLVEAHLKNTSQKTPINFSSVIDIVAHDTSVSSLSSLTHYNNQTHRSIFFFKTKWHYLLDIFCDEDIFLEDDLRHLNSYTVEKNFLESIPKPDAWYFFMPDGRSESTTILHDIPSQVLYEFFFLTISDHFSRPPLDRRKCAELKMQIDREIEKDREEASLFKNF